MSLVRFGVSMERELVALLDRIVLEERYSNRSEALRSLVRRELVRTGSVAPPPEKNDHAAGVVTLVYPYSQTLKNAPISPYPSLEISANLKLHLAGEVCLKVLVVQGLRGEVHAWAAPVVAQRGVTGDLTVVATDAIYNLLGAGGEKDGRVLATAKPAAKPAAKPGAAPPTLELTRGGVTLFSSTGRWLYPLFELERFFQESGVDPASCLLRDKLVGKAAALLSTRLGIRSLVTDIMSSPAERVLQRHRINYYTRDRVDRIDCATEDLLKDVDDPETAHVIIADRIARRT